MRRSVVVSAVGAVAAVTLTVVGGTAPGSAGAAQRAPGTIGPGVVAGPVSAGVPAQVRWGRCRDRALRAAGGQCANVAVPLDYGHPGGRMIRIAVSRIRHTVSRARYQGVMLVNPGGPGGSGLGLATVGQVMPAGSGRFYDWIGFDPRGVGASEPALSCRPSYFHRDRPPYIPRTTAILSTWLRRAQSYADSCQAAAPALLQHMRTTDVVRDMNRIRAALRAPRINYYGYSYGTYLGQVFATMFPGRVRRMVLDSNVNPTRVWYQANLDQGPAFERVIQRWFGWIARHHRAYRLGRTRFAVQRHFYRAEQALVRRPAGGVVGPSEWDDAFLVPAYAAVTWPDYAEVFAGWVHRREARPLIRAYRLFDTPGDDNLFAVYNAVQCSDAAWPRRWSRWSRDNWRLHRVAPFLTWGNVWFNAACRVWPVQPGRSVRVDGHRVRALLLGETLDPATPFSGSLEVRARFPRSSLVATRGGTTHAGSPTLSGRCVNARIAAYLREGRLPARRPGRRADVACRPLPVPEPRVRAGAAGAALPPAVETLLARVDGR
jgi:pimeloyl-ACP methyl ester carboxylesterase